MVIALEIAKWIILAVLTGLVTWLLVDTIIRFVKLHKKRKAQKQNQQIDSNSHESE